MKIEPPSRTGRAIKLVLKLTFLGKTSMIKEIEMTNEEKNTVQKYLSVFLLLSFEP